MDHILNHQNDQKIKRLSIKKIMVMKNEMNNDEKCFKYELIPSLHHKESNNLLERIRCFKLFTENCPAKSKALEEFKSALSGLRWFLAIENPLKIIKNVFYLT